MAWLASFVEITSTTGRASRTDANSNSKEGSKSTDKEKKVDHRLSLSGSFEAQGKGGRSP